MPLSVSALLLNPQPQPSRFFSLLPTATTTSLSLSSFSSSSLKLFPPKPPSFSLSSDDFVIGDCVVFEDGAFDDPYLLHDDEEETLAKPEKKNAKHKKEVPTENLVPDKWREVQAEINITKKERRKIARELEFGTRVEKKRSGLAPLKNVNLEVYLAFREAKLAQLKPLVLDNPEGFGNGEEEDEKKEEGFGNGEEEDEKKEEGFGNGEKKGNSSGRVSPRNPRWAVYGKRFDDVTEFFNGGNYVPAKRKSQGRRKLFSKEEKVLLNKRIPDLETATSEKWLPLHTLAASGAFYLVDTLLKHNVDINAVDKDGCTAIHKAIIGKKQAITNYLLRESANPFVRDKDGATLMHYAVRTASSQAIKILLLYNVDINLQDNDGWTPLHLAVQAKRTDVVKLLLIKGADETLKNKDGLTPLDLCLYSGGDTRNYELIKLLKLLPKQR